MEMFLTMYTPNYSNTEKEAKYCLEFLSLNMSAYFAYS
jgi:hypothetical protein